MNKEKILDVSGNLMGTIHQILATAFALSVFSLWMAILYLPDETIVYLLSDTTVTNSWARCFVLLYCYLAALKVFRLCVMYAGVFERPWRFMEVTEYIFGLFVTGILYAAPVLMLVHNMLIRTITNPACKMLLLSAGIIYVWIFLTGKPCLSGGESHA